MQSHRSDGKTSFEKVFKKRQRSPIVHFGERDLAHIQSQPPAQKLQIRASSQKSFELWLGKDVITGMHIVRFVTLMDGQILKTRTVTRLPREDQFKLDEFKKFKVATNDSGVLQGRFIRSDALQGSCSQVLTSTEESSHI